MKKIDAEQWENNLLPYRKFFDAYSPSEGWEPYQETVIPRSLTERIRIVFEKTSVIDNIGLDFGRHDALADRNIYDADVDAVEFAEELLKGPFGDHMSIRDLEAVIDVFQKHVDAWKIKRQEILDGSSKT